MELVSAVQVQDGGEHGGVPVEEVLPLATVEVDGVRRERAQQGSRIPVIDGGILRQRTKKEQMSNYLAHF